MFFLKDGIEFGNVIKILFVNVIFYYVFKELISIECGLYLRFLYEFLCTCSCGRRTSILIFQWIRFLPFVHYICHSLEPHKIVTLNLISSYGPRQHYLPTKEKHCFQMYYLLSLCDRYCFNLAWFLTALTEERSKLQCGVYIQLTLVMIHDLRSDTRDSIITYKGDFTNRPNLYKYCTQIAYMNLCLHLEMPHKLEAHTEQDDPSGNACKLYSRAVVFNLGYAKTY
jgi:hypothetical protein